MVRPQLRTRPRRDWIQGSEDGVEQFGCVIAVPLCVIALDSDELLSYARAALASEVKHEIDRVGNLMADHLVRQLNAALNDTRGEPSKSLLGSASTPGENTTFHAISDVLTQRVKYAYRNPV
jgi:hypothetical protein